MIVYNGFKYKEEEINELIERIGKRIKTIEILMWEDLENNEKWNRHNQRINNLKAEIIEIKMAK